jgi:hypothetical protein
MVSWVSALHVMDELEEVDLGDGDTSQPTYISGNLTSRQKEDMRSLVQEFDDCFAWEYTEMPSLSRELVEHRPPIKKGFKPYKPPARNYNTLLYDHIKKEVDRLLKASFICLCRYGESVSNIVPVEKKGTKKIRVCKDFRNLNRATSKDE